MIATNAYPVRFATAEDTEALTRLAELDSQQPLAGRVLIGCIDGTPAAALSFQDGRVIADPFRHTAQLVSFLRMRAGAIRAVETTPSLPDRLRAAFAAVRGGSVVAVPSASRDEQPEHEAARIAA
jgi:hypothetical protein